MTVNLNQTGYAGFTEPQVEALELILNSADIGGTVTVDSLADVLEAAATGAPADLARIQSSVSEYAVPKISPLAFAAKLAFRRLLVWGDSTVENMSTSGIPYAWGGNTIWSWLNGATETKNFGASGASTSAVIAASSLPNIGGNDCSIAGVAAEVVAGNVTALAVTFGINDFRQNTAAATLGNAAWIAEVQAMQQRLKTMIDGVRSASGKSKLPVAFMVPNTVAQTSTYITGIAGQVVTDSIRAVYLGRPEYGIQPITSIISICDVCDTGGAVFGVRSWPLTGLPNTMTSNDGIHPASGGYQNRTRYFSHWLASECANEFYEIARGVVTTSTGSVFDLTFHDRRARSMYGNTSGTAYSGLSSADIGVGDYVAFSTTAGRQVMRLSAQPYNNASEGYLRWISGPDGAWHVSDIPANTQFSVIRRGVLAGPALAARAGEFDVYPVRVTSGGSGTLTVIGLPASGGTKALSSRAPTTGDFLCLPAGYGTASMESPGTALTAATITAGAKIGEYTIAVSGEYATSAQQLGAILVPR